MKRLNGTKMMLVLGLLGMNLCISANPVHASSKNQHFKQQIVNAARQAKAATTNTTTTTTNHTSSNYFVEPYVCIDTATTNGGTIGAFRNVTNRVPFYANLDGPFDQVGLVVNVPSGTPAGTVSFEVVPNSTTSNLFIAVGGNYVTPAGTTGFFVSDNQPNQIAGNQAKGKNLQYTFSLPNLIDAVGNVPIPAGSTLTLLLIDVEELFPALVPGSVYIDNVSVNGHAVSQKVVVPVSGCPTGLGLK